MMKNTMQKVMLICLMAAVSLSAFGCSGKEEQPLPVETISLEQTKQKLTFDFKTGVVDDPVPEQDVKEENAEDSDSDADADASETSAEKKNTPKISVAETVYEEMTEVVGVTDADGQNVTDAAGEAVTDVAVVETRVVEIPATDAEGETVTEAQEDAVETETMDVSEAAKVEIIPPEPGAEQGSSYTPAYDTCKAYWLDMSKSGDYIFNGEFLTFTFQINQDIPDGTYPITISKTDIASWEERRYYPEIINGEIAVNTEKASQAEMSDKEFSLKVNSVEAKRGGVATITIDLANNPGFCGFILDVQYDSNAMTIIEAGAGKDYDQAVNVD